MTESVGVTAPVAVVTVVVVDATAESR